MEKVTLIKSDLTQEDRFIILWALDVSDKFVKEDMIGMLPKDHCKKLLTEIKNMKSKIIYWDKPNNGESDTETTSSS